MKKATFIFLLLSISSVVWMQQVPTITDLSNDLKTCHVDNKTELSKCVLDFWNDIKPILITGVNNGPTIDPMHMGDVVLPETYTNIKGKLKFFEIILRGFGEYVVKSATADINNMTITVELVIPHLNVECRYDFNATFLLVPVVGSGPFHAVFKDMDCVLTLHLQQKEEAAGNVGELYLSKTEFEVVPESLKVNLAEIFGGPEISAVVHDLLHDNMDLLYEDIKFNVGDEIANRGLHKVLEGVISQLPPEIFTRK